MKITQFNQQNLKLMRKEINDALKAVTEKYGTPMKLGNISFESDGSAFTGKLEVRASGAGSKEDKMREESEQYADMFGLPKGLFGEERKTFKHQGKTYTVLHLDMKKRKYPVIVSDGNNQYKFPADIVSKALA